MLMVFIIQNSQNRDSKAMTVARDNVVPEPGFALIRGRSSIGISFAGAATIGSSASSWSTRTQSASVSTSRRPSRSIPRAAGAFPACRSPSFTTRGAWRSPRPGGPALAPRRSACLCAGGSPLRPADGESGTAGAALSAQTEPVEEDL
ncbi:MAG: hypothetical protein ABR610_03120 [Thermoanaerobaculia bacterium]